MMTITDDFPLDVAQHYLNGATHAEHLGMALQRGIASADVCEIPDLLFGVIDRLVALNVKHDELRALFDACKRQWNERHAVE